MKLTDWDVQVNIDWAGIALERASGLRLNDYLLKNVLRPLGLQNMNMIPTPEMRARMAYMHQRDSSGTIRARDHLHRAPILVDASDEEAVGKIFHSGGAGMYSKPQEYTSKLTISLPPPPSLPSFGLNQQLNTNGIL